MEKSTTKIDYTGLVINHWWLVSNRRRNKVSSRIVYTLTNQANGQVVDNVQETTITRVLSGKIQISQLISKRIKKANGRKAYTW